MLDVKLVVKPAFIFSMGAKARGHITPPPPPKVYDIQPFQLVLVHFYCTVSGKEKDVECEMKDIYSAIDQTICTWLKDDNIEYVNMCTVV